MNYIMVIIFDHLYFILHNIGEPIQHYYKQKIYPALASRTEIFFRQRHFYHNVYSELSLQLSSVDSKMRAKEMIYSRSS